MDEDDVRVCIVADIERLGGWTLNSISTNFSTLRSEEYGDGALLENV